MAKKQAVRKALTKKPLKSKTASKKKTAAKKKGKAVSGSKVTGTTKKPKKVAKPTAKKRTPAKAASGKKKGVAKKSVLKQTKAATKKTVVKSTPKPKKIAKKKPLVQKKKTSIAKKKVKSGQAKKPSQKNATSSAPAAQRLPKSQEPLLSSVERYNIGGLFACAIERALDPDCTRLRAVLRHLGLSSQEKDNLIRLSEGFMIPKLFADSVAEAKVGLVLTDLVKFSMAEGSYAKHWREEIQQIGLWLGIFPAQFQAIEQQVKR